MKKLLCLILALTLVLCCAACGSGKEGDAPAITQQMLAGTAEGSVYTNEAICIRVELDDTWSIFDKTQLAAISGITTDAADDEAFAEKFRESGTGYAFYAIANDGLYNLGIVWEDLGKLYGKVIDEETYAEIGVSKLPEALESAGAENITAKATNISFAGQDHPAIVVTGEMMGVSLYETLVCIKVGDYMAVITAASYMENATGQILAMASGI